MQLLTTSTDLRTVTFSYPSPRTLRGLFLPGVSATLRTTWRRQVVNTEIDSRSTSPWVKSCRVSTCFQVLCFMRCAGICLVVPPVLPVCPCALFHTPLNQNATFDHEHRSPDRDFFIPLSIKTLLLTSSMGLQTVTLSYPSESKCYL